MEIKYTVIKSSAWEKQEVFNGLSVDEMNLKVKELQSLQYGIEVLTDSEYAESKNENYQEVKSQFKVNRLGIITSPGKFEGESLATPYFYNCMMDGSGNIMQIDAEERSLFSIEERYNYVIVYESNDGFSSCAYFETLQAAEMSIFNIETEEESDNEL